MTASTLPAPGSKKHAGAIAMELGVSETSRDLLAGVIAVSVASGACDSTVEAATRHAVADERTIALVRHLAQLEQAAASVVTDTGDARDVSPARLAGDAWGLP